MSMWSWIHEHSGDLAALGPIATIVASFIAVCVTTILGTAQFAIARSQRDLARDKLKLDLFERRFAVYQAAKSLSNTLRPNSTKRIEYERFDEWSATLTEARYLFSSSVVALAQKIIDLAFEWERNLEVIDGMDEETLDILRRRQEAISKEMSGLHLFVEGVFDPELAYKELT